MIRRPAPAARATTRQNPSYDGGSEGKDPAKPPVCPVLPTWRVPPSGGPAVATRIAAPGVILEYEHASSATGNTVRPCPQPVEHSAERREGRPVPDRGGEGSRVRQGVGTEGA